MEEDTQQKEPSVEEISQYLDKRLKGLRKNTIQEILYSEIVNTFEIYANAAKSATEKNILESGEPPEGYIYKTDAYFLWYSKAHEVALSHHEKMAENLRAAMMNEILKEYGYSKNAFIALERVIISDHERRKVEKRHQNSVKAKFQQDAIQKWQATNGKKSRVAFSLQYRDELKAKHRIDLDYRTIAEDWLKDH